MMKFKSIVSIALLLCIVQEIWAWEGAGTSFSPYLIQSSADWKMLADNVKSGNNYGGRYFEMKRDIDAQGISVGSESAPFSGTFDGYGHTLNYNSTPTTHEDIYCDFLPVFHTPKALVANDKTILYMGSDSKLYYPTAAFNINSFRAYFKLQKGLTAADIKASAKSIVLNFDGETTGIEAIDHSPLTIDHSAGAWFTLDGRKLSGKPTQRGMYINNGKKVIK